MFPFQKPLLTALSLLFSLSVFAQDTPNEKLHVIQWPNSKTSFTILLDSTVFNKSDHNMYASDLYDEAFIAVMFMDTTGNSDAEIETLEPGKQYPMEDYDTAVRERIQKNGQDCIRISRLLEAPSGSLMTYIYVLAIDVKFSLMMTAVCREQDDAVLAPIFEKAALSLRLKE